MLPEPLGTLLVVLIIVGAAFLCIRSLWKSHKKGGACSACSGNCASCGGACHPK